MGRIFAAARKKIDMINFWQDQILPYTWNPKDQTLLWSGTDQLNNQDIKWEFPISYIFNPQGFRTYDFDLIANEEINVALGCSQTLGIGLPIEMTWPYLLEKETNIKTLNLGIGGANTDTVARIITNIVESFKINSVYILWPSFNRFEHYHSEHIADILPNNALLEHVWYMDHNNSLQRFYKNQKIVHMLKKLHSFSLHELELDNTDWRIPGDLARDQIHSGYKSNLNLVKLFLTKD